MTESGFAGVAFDVWFGLVAPAGTPDAVIDKLNAAFVRAVRDPNVVKQMTEQGAEVVATTPAEFAASSRPKPSVSQGGASGRREG